MDSQVAQLFDKKIGIARKTFSSTLLNGPNIDKDPSSPNFCRFIIDKRSETCQFCSAIMWTNERVKSTSRKNNLLFSMCCNSGRVQLPVTKVHPVVKGFLTGRDFRSNHLKESIRMYNSILSFTSVKANVDENLSNNKCGSYTYRINGSVHHCIGDLIPQDIEQPKFSQIYIFDQALQTDIRKRMMPSIKVDILNELQQ